MHLRRIILSGAVLLLMAFAALVAYTLRTDATEEAQIRARYQQFVLALASADTNAAKVLFAPPFRAVADQHIMRLRTFAKPLDARSTISVSSCRALVCPEPLKHYLVLPGGHSVEMIKSEQQWFFTGKVFID
jgi:hypothetical protein